MTAPHLGTSQAHRAPAGAPAPPPPPPPPPRAVPPEAPAPAARPAAVSPVHRPDPSLPQDPYFVKAAAPAPVVFEPVAASPAPPQDSWLKPALAVIALLVGAFGGLWAVRALGSDDPVLNKGADGEVSTIDAESIFAPLNGYQYKSLPNSLEDEMNEIFAAIPEAREQLLGLGVRGVMKGGQVSGIVVAAGVKPETIEDRAERQSAFDGLEEAGGSEPQKVRLGGLDAYTTDISTGNLLIPKAQAVIYFYENLVVIVIGFDETTAQDVATKLIQTGP